MKLHLGVIDLPYADASYRDLKVRKPSGGHSGSITTGDVAEILEDRYAIMEAFFSRHGDEVEQKFMESIEGAIESINMGAPIMLDPFGAATSQVEDMFKQMLINRELDGMYGVPTKASLEGVSHRRKHPYAKRGVRPSFIDTGLYMGAFKVWVEE